MVRHFQFTLDVSSSDLFDLLGLPHSWIIATVKSAYERLFNSATYESHPVPRKFLVIATIVFSVSRSHSRKFVSCTFHL